MSTHFLVPIDGSRPAWNALNHAVTDYDPATLTVLTVIDPLEGMYLSDAQLESGVIEVQRQRYEDRLEDASGRIKQTGFTGEVELVLEFGRPQQVIPEYADEVGADQIIMGSTGRTGLERVAMGSIAEAVTRRATVPVTVVRA